jgi:poly(ADP-ribose) glycohydrolase ARH3
LRDKFRGCFLGATIGDIAGAVVEAESPGYIASTFSSIDQILATDAVEEFTGPPWKVGRFTDDTQMMLCVAEWLAAGEAPSGEHLLARFSDAFEPWRRYGSGTEMILRAFAQHRSQWRELSTMMFPEGSYGNGSAMRVAPVGLAFAHDLNLVSSVAIESSRPTHSHPLAYQGAVIQAMAVASAATMTESDPSNFLRTLRSSLTRFEDLLQDISRFAQALDEIESGLKRDASCLAMSSVLGTGIAAYEAVPMAIYCFLRNTHSYPHVIHDAVFIGGDTDTIASMAGAISGAFLGRDAIPEKWLKTVREEAWTVGRIEDLADRLFSKYTAAKK